MTRRREKKAGFIYKDRVPDFTNYLSTQIKKHFPEAADKTIREVLGIRK